MGGVHSSLIGSKKKKIWMYRIIPKRFIEEASVEMTVNREFHSRNSFKLK